MNLLKDMKKSLVSTAIIAIILGFVMLIFPGFVNDFFSTIVGLFILFVGVSRLAFYLETPSYGFMSRVNLFFGILLVLFGLYVLINPKFITSIIPVIAGVIIIVSSINKIKEAVEFKEAKYSKWWVNLVTSILFLLLGILLIFNPFTSVKWMIRVFGILLVVDGVYELINIKMYSKDVNKVIKSINIE